MTEAARPLPVRQPGPRPLPPRTAGSATLGLVPPIAAARPAGPTRRPIHVVVAVGMTAGLYAISLAGVTALQSASDLQLAAGRVPAADAVAGLKSAHDAMESSLGTLTGAYAHAADSYTGIANGIVGHEKALAKLGQQVQAAAGWAAALSVPAVSITPPRLTVPSSGSNGPVARTSTPSAGKAAGSSNSAPAAAAAAAPAPVAAAAPAPVVAAPKPAPLPVISVSPPVVSAPPPPVHACTTASGKPC